MMGPTIILLVAAALVQGSQATERNWTLDVSTAVDGQKGLCMRLPCNYTLPEGLQPNLTSAVWSRNHPYPAGTVVYHPDPRNISLEYRTRAWLWGNLSQFDCSLFITGLRGEDGERFYIQIRHPEINQTLNASLLLNVSDLQVKPNISSAAELVEGTLATLTCRVPLPCGGEGPQLTWSGLAHLSRNTTTHNGTQNATLFTNLSFMPSASDHGKEITCYAHYPLNSTQTNQIYQLDVRYAPRIEEISLETLNEGGHMEVMCNVTSNPESRVWWSRDDETGPRLLVNGTTLGIHNISRSHQGLYTCHANNSYGEATTVMNLTVHFPPRILEMNTTAVVSEGTNLTLVCSVEAQPEPNVTWTRGSDMDHILSKQPKLTIPSVSDMDSGSYTCWAKNRLGSTNRTVLVTVGYAPRNLTIQASVNGTAVSLVKMEEFESLTLRCWVESVPVAGLSWQVNEEERNRSEGESELWLRVDSVTYREDGTHRCTARNVLGQAQVDVQVSIQYAPRAVEVRVIGGRPVREGDNVSLTCWCTANPPVTNTSWYRMVPGAGPEHIDTGRTLHLGRVARGNESAYFCTATNSRGSRNSSVFPLTVQYKPEISRMSGCARVAKGVTCVCEARWNPPGELRWLLPLANLSGNQTHGRFQTELVTDGQLVTGSLTLRGGEGEEDLTALCAVRNRHGEVMFKVYLWVKGRRWSFQELLIPVLGSAAATLILSVVICQLLLCCSRRIKPTQKVSTEMQVLTTESRPEDETGADHNAGTEDVSPHHHPSGCTHSLSDEAVESWPADETEADFVDATPPPEQNGELGATPEDQDSELHYACIDFSKARSSDEIVGSRDSTQYAQIKPQ
ncbi:myelin-associated glycoprotein-like isoform X1 [Mobula hypostoma]|uniref:myelin-associated glycoprotein-like isoform X1 n=1 Tax=Mobula hypostoma TaxID=723540 RepID=UPI002FC2DF2D